MTSGDELEGIVVACGVMMLLFGKMKRLQRRSFAIGGMLRSCRADVDSGQLWSKQVAGQRYVPERLQEQVCEKLKSLAYLERSRSYPPFPWGGGRVHPHYGSDTFSLEARGKKTSRRKRNSAELPRHHSCTLQPLTPWVVCGTISTIVGNAWSKHDGASTRTCRGGFGVRKGKRHDHRRARKS